MTRVCFDTDDLELGIDWWLLSQQRVAVSSSPRPWIDVFASPEKPNMAVTESDLDPDVRKMPITFQWLCDLWAEHAGMELKSYWF